jgi:prepilin-type processing-associated H-X9-DG protein
MTDKKKIIDPVRWASDCCKGVFVYLSVVAVLWLSSFALQYFGEDGIAWYFFKPIIFIVAVLFYLLPVVIFLGSIIALFGLFLGRNRSIRPWLHASLSLMFCFAAFWFIMYSYGKSMNNASVIVCGNNARHLAKLVLNSRASQIAGFKNDKWCDLIKAETISESSMKCVWDHTGPCSYAMNADIPDDASDLPPDLVLLFESAPGWNRTGGPADVVTDRHGKHRPGANIAFADGRVEFVPSDAIPALRWTVEPETDRMQLDEHTPK